MKKKKVFRGWMTETLDPHWSKMGSDGCRKLIIPIFTHKKWEQGNVPPRKVTVTFEWEEE